MNADRHGFGERKSRREGRGLFLIVLCVGMAVMSGASAAAGPRLVIDEPHHDFETAYSGTESEHTFMLRNEGDDPLTIHRVHSSCGCTVTKLTNTVISPGEQEPLIANISLKNRHGPQRMNIAVQSDDPENPIYRLRIEGRAIRDFEVRPRLLNFGTLAPGSPATRTLDLISDEEPFALQDIAANTTGLGLRVVEVKPDHHYRVVVMLSEETATGKMEGNLLIRTDHPRRREITVPLVGHITARSVIVSPEVLTLPASWEGPITRHVVIRAVGDNNPFSIEQIDLPHDEMKVRTFPMGNIGYRLQVTNLRAEQLDEDADINITTDLPEAGSIIIPIRRQNPQSATRLAGGGGK